MELLVSFTGQVTALYDETIDLPALGPLRITRASHVEPQADGWWRARIVDGPTLGPFARRSEALAAEAAWLNQRLIAAAEISPTDSGGRPLA